jgi:energy-coupling factor transport system permease protein
MLATFKYLPGRTVIHRLDPRAKLFVFALAVVATIVTWDVRMLVALFLVTLLGYYAPARLPWRLTWKAWAVVGFFAIVIIGILNTTVFGQPQAFIDTHHPWFSFPRIGSWQRTVTYELGFVGLVRLMRPLVIMAAILPFTFTTDPYLYGVAFRRMGLPDGAAFALDLSLRYVPTVARDFFTTVDAQRARGYELERRGAGVINMIRRAAPLLVPVTINAISGGEEVVEAMELRAYGVGKRTWSAAGALGFKFIDWLYMGGAAAVLLTIILLTAFTSYGPWWFPVDWFE